MPTAPTTPDLGELLMRATRGLRHRWAGSLEPWQLTPHQARALQVVGELDGARLGTLAARLRIAPRSATEVIDGLEDHELVARSADPDDRRATCVTLTDRGRGVLAEVSQARVASAATHFAALSPAERTTLAELLAKLEGPTRDERRPGAADAPDQPSVRSRRP